MKLSNTRTVLISNKLHIIMEIRRVVPNISTDCMAESLVFYTEFLGFQVVMDMDWIVTLASPTSSTAQISLLRSVGNKGNGNDGENGGKADQDDNKEKKSSKVDDTTTSTTSTNNDNESNNNSSIFLSIEVLDNIDSLYADAQSRNYTIVYPITNEPWDVRRFQILDPNGVKLNIMCHKPITTSTSDKK